MTFDWLRPKQSLPVLTPSRWANAASPDDPATQRYLSQSPSLRRVRTSLADPSFSLSASEFRLSRPALQNVRPESSDQRLSHASGFSQDAIAAASFAYQTADSAKTHRPDHHHHHPHCMPLAKSPKSPAYRLNRLPPPPSRPLTQRPQAAEASLAKFDLPEIDERGPWSRQRTGGSHRLSFGNDPDESSHHASNLGRLGRKSTVVTPVEERILYYRRMERRSCHSPWTNSRDRRNSNATSSGSSTEFQPGQAVPLRFQISISPKNKIPVRRPLPVVSEDRPKLGGSSRYLDRWVAEQPMAQQYGDPHSQFKASPTYKNSIEPANGRLSVPPPIRMTPSSVTPCIAGAYRSSITSLGHHQDSDPKLDSQGSFWRQREEGLTCSPVSFSRPTPLQRDSNNSSSRLLFGIPQISIKKRQQKSRQDVASPPKPPLLKLRRSHDQGNLANIVPQREVSTVTYISEASQDEQPARQVGEWSHLPASPTENLHPEAEQCHGWKKRVKNLFRRSMASINIRPSLTSSLPQQLPIQQVESIQPHYGDFDLPPSRFSINTPTEADSLGMSRQEGDSKSRRTSFQFQPFMRTHRRESAELGRSRRHTISSRSSSATFGRTRPLDKDDVEPRSPLASTRVSSHSRVTSWTDSTTMQSRVSSRSSSDPVRPPYFKRHASMLFGQIDGPNSELQPIAEAKSQVDVGSVYNSGKRKAQEDEGERRPQVSQLTKALYKSLMNLRNLRSDSGSVTEGDPLERPAEGADSQARNTAETYRGPPNEFGAESERRAELKAVDPESSIRIIPDKDKESRLEDIFEPIPDGVFTPTRRCSYQAHQTHSPADQEKTASSGTAVVFETCPVMSFPLGTEKRRSDQDVQQPRLYKTSNDWRNWLSKEVAELDSVADAIFNADGEFLSRFQEENTPAGSQNVGSAAEETERADPEGDPAPAVHPDLSVSPLATREARFTTKPARSSIGLGWKDLRAQHSEGSLGNLASARQSLRAVPLAYSQNHTAETGDHVWRQSRSRPFPRSPMKENRPISRCSGASSSLGPTGGHKLATEFLNSRRLQNTREASPSLSPSPSPVRLSPARKSVPLYNWSRDPDGPWTRRSMVPVRGAAATPPPPPPPGQEGASQAAESPVFL